MAIWSAMWLAGGGSNLNGKQWAMPPWIMVTAQLDKRGQSAGGTSDAVGYVQRKVETLVEEGVRVLFVADAELNVEMTASEYLMRIHSVQEPIHGAQDLWLVPFMSKGIDSIFKALTTNTCLWEVNLETLEQRSLLGPIDRSVRGFVKDRHDAQFLQFDIKSDYLPPTYAFEKIEAARNRLPDRGYIHVKGPAGIGKSVIIKALRDGWAKDFSGATIGYSVLHGRPEHPREFLQRILSQARHLNDSRDELFDLPNICSDSESLTLNQIRNNLWEVLNETRKYWCPDGVLILAVDGINELTDVADDSELPLLLDTLPDAESLPHGCYILLTSRERPLRSTIAKSLKNRTANSEYLEEVTLRLDDPAYVSTLGQYILDASRLGLDAERHLDHLLRRAEHRFLYVRLLVRLLIGKDLARIDPGVLPQGSNIFPAYLERMSECVDGGKALFEEWHKPVLGLVASAYEPICRAHLREWLGLNIGNAKDIHRLNIALDELKALFHIDDDIGHQLPDDSYFALGHDIFAQWLEHNDNNHWRSIVDYFGHKSISSYLHESFAGQWHRCNADSLTGQYALRYGLKHARQSAERDHLKLALDPTFAATLLASAESSHRKTRYMLAADLAENAFEAFSLQIENGDTKCEILAREARLIRAISVRDVGQPEIASVLIQEIDEQDASKDGDFAALRHLNLGVIHADAGAYEDAIREFDKAIEIRHKQIPLPFRIRSLSRVLTNKGNYLRYMGHLDDAEAVLKSSINALEQLEKVNRDDNWKIYCADAQNKLGLVYSDNGSPLDAIRCHDMAVSLLKQVSTFTDEASGDMLSNFNNLAVAHLRAKAYDNVIPVATKAIELGSRLVKSGRPEMRAEWLRALINRSGSLKHKGDKAASLLDLEQAMSLAEEDDIHSTVEVLTNILSAFYFGAMLASELGQSRTAMKYSNRGMEWAGRVTQSREVTRELWNKLLGSVEMNVRLALMQLDVRSATKSLRFLEFQLVPERFAALSDEDKSPYRALLTELTALIASTAPLNADDFDMSGLVAETSKILETDRSLRPSETIAALTNRGFAFLASGKHDDALTDFDTAEKEYNRTRDCGAILLSQLFVNRSEVHKLRGELSTANEYATKAVDVFTRAEPLDGEDLLVRAKALHCRGDLRCMQDQHELAEKDYTRGHKNLVNDSSAACAHLRAILFSKRSIARVLQKRPDDCLSDRSANNDNEAWRFEEISATTAVVMMRLAVSIGNTDLASRIFPIAHTRILCSHGVLRRDTSIECIEAMLASSVIVPAKRRLKLLEQLQDIARADRAVPNQCMLELQIANALDELDRLNDAKDRFDSVINSDLTSAPEHHAWRYRAIIGRATINEQIAAASFGKHMKLMSAMGAICVHQSPPDKVMEDYNAGIDGLRKIEGRYAAAALIWGLSCRADLYFKTANVSPEYWRDGINDLIDGARVFEDLGVEVERSDAFSLLGVVWMLKTAVPRVYAMFERQLGTSCPHFRDALNNWQEPPRGWQLNPNQILTQMANLKNSSSQSSQGNRNLRALVTSRTGERCFENSASRNVRIGRNELCPCGSEKKYKKCCGKNR